ncbi:CPBP family intramembrane glutamic endopeptidase [Litchfieldia alkalitelluris]|uniref:CPBP family intramembrane glutamic endopeptidase n=1 Tax=Litchfieldia alkalitelluris TaxID=304268 RepID=UPI00099829AA|nr:CPBP family intramembrane glutamic endopeptidase [Litchfieldia alkalitelluris]
MNRQADMIKNMPNREIIYHLYLTQCILLIISIVLGVMLFDDFSSFKNLWKIDTKIIVIGGAVALSVILIDFILSKWLPKEMLDDGGINRLLFQNLNIIHIFFVCFIISFTEELLFRGVLQTHFGLIIASLIFALLHVRYLYKWVLLLAVISLSFLLGYVYELTQNLWITIFAHFLIDFVFAVKIRLDYLKGLN